MKILILTQKIDKNDDLLGFFHGWVEKLALKFEGVTVIALGVGQYDLPDNVKVLSLGKEKLEIGPPSAEPGRGRGKWKVEIIKKLKYSFNFFRYIWRERKNYGTVFIHMNQEYAILGGIFWRLLGKKIALWRNHPRGDFLARLAVFFSDAVFCTSKFAYVAKFKKTQIMPVGVDTDFFKPDPAVQKVSRSVLFFGRISPIKKIGTLIEALNILSAKNIAFSAKIVGNAPQKDQLYLDQIKQSVEGYNLSSRVEFKSGVPNFEAPAVFNQHEIFINLTPSGSMDKTIFEAMACGTLILVSNKNLGDILPDELANLLVFQEGDAAGLANKISGLFELPMEKSLDIRQKLRQVAAQSQSLDVLMEKLIEKLT